MNIRSYIGTVGLLVALPLSAGAGVTAYRLPPVAPEVAPAIPKVETQQAFREGEDLTFAIKWGVLTGGYSSLKVQNIETINGQPTYHVVAEARSSGLVDKIYNVHDRNEAWMEPGNPSTLRYARQIHEGQYRVQEDVVLDQASHRFHQHFYRIDKKRYEDKDGDIPPNVLDVLGSLYYVRTLPLEVGKSYTFDVQSEDKVYPLVVYVKKRQTIRVKAGKFDCFLVEPQLRAPGIFISKGKKLEVWLTADERRMPVLMRSEVFIGHVAAELVSHRSIPPSETYNLTKAQPLDDSPDTATLAQ